MADRSLLFWILPPLAPLAAAILLLGLAAPWFTDLPGALPPVVDPGPPETTTLFYAEGRELRFFNALVTYAGIALFQVAACIGVIGLIALRIAALARPPRTRALIVAGATMALLVLLGLLARSDGMTGALNLTYRHICAVLTEAVTAEGLLPGSCTEAGISRFAWLALLPLLAGLLASVAANALTCTAFAPVTQTDPAAASAELERRARTVDLTFQATAFVLVASTLALVLFYRLPLALIEAELARDLMTGFAQGMTLFWGIVFTLTLAAIFGPGTLILTRHLRAEHLASIGPDLPEGLLPQSTRKRIAGMLTTLAPLLIGASGSVLETIAGAL